MSTVNLGSKDKVPEALGRAGRVTFHCIPSGTGTILQKENKVKPWPGGSIGWKVVLYIKMLQVRSPVRTCTGGNRYYSLTSMSLSFDKQSINVSLGDDFF